MASDAKLLVRASGTQQPAAEITAHPHNRRHGVFVQRLLRGLNRPVGGGTEIMGALERPGQAGGIGIGLFGDDGQRNIAGIQRHPVAE